MARSVASSALNESFEVELSGLTPRDSAEAAAAEAAAAEAAAAEAAEAEERRLAEQADTERLAAEALAAQVNLDDPADIEAAYGLIGLEDVDTALTFEDLLAAAQKVAACVAAVRPQRQQHRKERRAFLF